ncbi:HD domain-containing protein, partial [Candidatus Woesebacteria bacterium]|nr:HD domain-containing protein [Candidatus Woesebacteria bacterium]
MHNHEQEAAIMKRFGVSNLPAASEYTLPQTEVTPSFYVVSALLSQGKTFDVAASYLSPTIENNTNRFELDFSDSIPEEVFTICKLVSSLGGRALLVGGCIRDLLYSDITTTKITPKDFDLEIYGLDFDTVTRMLITAFPNNKCEFKGKSFGVTKLYFDGLAEPLDIAIPRTEVSTGEKHTDFETVMNPQLDFIDGARRRDLRFNSITYDPLTKTIYDPFLGLLDLQQKEINVTDPETFIEDPLRVLRIMQFAARFEMTPTNETVSLCTRMVAEGKLDHLAAERVRDELKKLLIKGTKPSIGLRFIQEIGYLERYWPELQALVGTPQHQNFHPEGDVWEHTLQAVDAATLICEREHLPADKKLTVMLTILLHDVGKPATTTLDENGYYRAFGHEEAGVEPTLAVLQRLMFENKTQKEVAALLPRHMIIPSLYKNHLNGTSSDTALRRLSRKLWKEAE